MTAVLGGAPVRRAGRALLHLGTLAVGACCVGAALLGALYAGPRVLPVALVSGAAAWALARSIRRLADAARPAGVAAPPPSNGVLVATAAALVVPFGTGIQVLGAAGAHLLLVAVGLLSVHGTVWIHRLDPGAVPAGRGGPAPLREDPADTCPPPELLRTLPLEDLVAEWHASGDQVHRSSAARRHAVVQWREAVLEEIRRRDPEGFDHWLCTGAAGAPERHLRAVADDTAPRPDESAC
ncbi:hypothetical protein SAMN05660464_1034 [Geodermatophilus dictyosporus]|uniref:Uncharacterized protein n=1 Tax=Geodermatophilus dictyosporus TaxID=1523247 RepID=A0A1I5JUI4_9ACTN|nr:hypothetical protein [Geodermatophilus dictyosporus]SFO76163.1 hypothetical protein SAMN05660464_1034 [Geodermatophilus dictyosporus]